MQPDYETDTVIQASLRDELKKDVTLLTIAHRLQTIMDSDKIVSSLHIMAHDTRYSPVMRDRWSLMQGAS